MAQYPNGIFTPREKENRAGVVYNPNKKSVIFAEDIKALDEEVVAIETELGTNPKGNFSSVKEFLQFLLSKVISAFTDIPDVPHSYQGQGGKVVKVKTTEDGLEFGEVSSGGPIIVKKTSDQQNTTTTLQDVDDLQFSLEPNKIYLFEFIVVFQTAATTTGIRLDISGPTSPQYIVWWREIPLSAQTAGTDNIQDRQLVTYQSDSATASIGVANQNFIARITGIIANGPNADVLKLQFASEVANSAVTIKKGSFGRLWN